MEEEWCPDAPARPDGQQRGRAHGQLHGALITLLGGTCWGFSGTMASLLFGSYGVDPIWLLSVRQICAGLLFLVYNLLVFPTEMRGVWTCPADRRLLLAFAFVGLLPSMLLYLVCVQMTNAGTATVLQCLQLVIIMVVTCIRVRRAPMARELAGVGFALVGTYLIATGGDPTTLSMPALALVAGLVCAATTAAMSLLPARLLPVYGSSVVTGSAMLVCGVATTIAVRPWSCAPTLDAFGWFVLAGFIVVGTFFAFLFYLQGVREIGGMKASLLGTVEPVVATVLAVVVLNTVFAPTDILGFALIIAMVFLTV